MKVGDTYTTPLGAETILSIGFVITTTAGRYFLAQWRAWVVCKLPEVTA